jgi:predicted RNA binding protein YcfA (HicA-like mRNA interferase family)
VTPHAVRRPCRTITVKSAQFPRSTHGNPPSHAGLVKVRELIRLLEDDGWHLVRTRGSHRQFKHPVKRGTVTVAGNLGVDVPHGTLRAILKFTRLNRPRGIHAVRSSH